MSFYNAALQLSRMGFHVFPLIENSKLPAVKSFTEIATNNPDIIKTFWLDPILEMSHANNIGIATSKFGEGQALIVLDIDNKKGKEGSKTLLKLELEGLDFPKTLTQKTPSGGIHLIYKTQTPLKQGVNIWPGIDVRSKGGFIVGAGSLIDGKPYTFDKNSITQVANAPQWLIDKLKIKEKSKLENKKPLKAVSQKTAALRAKEFLLNDAPVAVEGQGGDQTTFFVAAKLKDLGLSPKNALNLMLDNWNEHCSPPWLPEELETKISNAYTYGAETFGKDSPENDFEKIDDQTICDPVEELNKEFSFIVIGGKSTILRQNATGGVDYMNVQAFHDLLKAGTIQTGNGRKRQLSQVWFSSSKRATYNSIELRPNEKTPHDVYNLWRGFAVTPLSSDEKPTKDMIKGVSLFKEHAFENVCRGNEELYKWLIGYFAHVIQKPNEKPLTALVFKGKKGVGKNALVERFGHLLGGHFLLTSNPRYIKSNFNKHLANLIFFVLDEAIWSGDKQAEGILKDLITGSKHLIEQKGREMYVARNLTRICVVGNEDWLVPATEDERRFAVFNVGSKRMRDKNFFTEMRECLDDKGGSRLLLRELKNYDLSSIDINEAPETEGLIDQKLETLEPVHAWWYSSLVDGAILNLDFQEQNWPENVGKDQLRDAFFSYAKKRGVSKWLPDASSFGRDIKKCCPEITEKRLRDSGSRLRVYQMPNLQACRHQFDAFIGHKLNWEDIESGANVIDAKKLFK